MNLTTQEKKRRRIEYRFTRKLYRTSQHRTKNVKTCNLTTRTTRTSCDIKIVLDISISK